MALSVNVALVVLVCKVDCHREFRLALENLRGMRSSRDRVAHLRERRGEEGVMGVIGARDPREGFSRVGVFFCTVASAPEMAPETLRVVRVETHRLLDPVDAFLRPSQP